MAAKRGAGCRRSTTLTPDNALQTLSTYPLPSVDHHPEPTVTVLSLPLRIRPAAALLAWGLLSACARAAPPVTAPVMREPVVVSAPAPTPAGSPSATAAGARRGPAARESAPANWHRLDLDKDGVLGVGSERALSELLATRQPARKVVVAVIDGGVDTAHTLLASTLWKNPRETAGNNRDDDGNGLADDVFGWNYIGGRSGESIHHDTFELTRLYSACRELPAGRGIPKPDASECQALARAYSAKKGEITGTLGQIASIAETFDRASGILTGALSGTLTEARVRALTPATPEVAQAKQVWLQLVANGLDAAEIAEAKKAYDGQFRFALDTMFNPRTIVGDQGVQPPSRAYGNRNVTGPDASHGTHVAGIIGARRDRGGDVQGIAPSVEIMAIRTVPDGDERDEDVANAIRYAVDNGANVINMSFGKSYSPKKAVVDSAVRYAESKGVLLVHAAGNDAENTDVAPSFPTPMLDASTRASNWIEVGASSWKGGAEIPASFSNYGRNRVDLFAPGADILSTLPDGKTGKESGTSMAAPVVAGVAALIMSYFPKLTAADVKQLLMESARSLGDVDVVPPGGDGARVKFSTLSRTGAVIDAYAAVKLALTRVQ